MMLCYIRLKTTTENALFGKGLHFRKELNPSIEQQPQISLHPPLLLMLKFV